MGQPGIGSPTPRSYPIKLGATFHEGDFVTLAASSSATTPNPTGALASDAGPAASAITFGTAASSGAPAATYYIIATYTATSQESQPSAEYVVNVPAGYVPTVNVSATGKPSGATNFAAYAGVYEGGETLQQASKTTTALGTAFDIPNPLINLTGLVRATSNADSGIAGLTLQDSAKVYATGIGGSQTAGGPTDLLGTWANPPPLAPNDPQQALVVALVNGAPIEISLKQPWYPSLQGAAAGITLDTSQQADGIFIADTSATAALTIYERLDVSGSTGDTGARVRAIFNASAVI